ncbi:MAG: hypothetical protein ACYS8Z_07645 [Planctomycetota bacterium]|jgi:hypothetical protein
MRKEIDELFEESVSCGNASDALIILCLLVEKSLIPALAVTNTKLLSGLCASDIEPTKTEAYEILDRIVSELSRSRADVNTKATWCWLLGKFSKLEYLKAQMQFLQENYQQLGDQTAYSVLASINPQYFGEEEREQVQSLVRASGLIEVLMKLGDREDDHLNQALFHMWGKIRQIGLADECANIYCLKASVWLLADEWRTMYSDDANSILAEIPLERIGKAKSEKVRTILHQHNFMEVLTELENRTFDDLKDEFVRACADELLPILEQDEDEEAQERRYEEEHHAKLKDTIERTREAIRRI